MRNINIVAACISFLLVLIAVFFGASIHNANTNMHITYLNEMDNIHYFDVNRVPQLTRQATIFTLPLLIGILVLELIITVKGTVRQVKNIAIGLAIAMLIVIVFDVLIMSNAQAYDFSRWGYIWITMGVFSLAGNALCVFITGNKPVAKKV